MAAYQYPPRRKMLAIAYAASIVADVLSDCALAGFDPPRTLEEAAALLVKPRLGGHKAGDIRQLGMMFEETVLQGNFAALSVGCMHGRVGYSDAAAFRMDAERIATGMLQTAYEEVAAT